MIATDDDRQHWCNLFTGIVSRSVDMVCQPTRQRARGLLIEITKLSILLRYSHALQIAVIPNGLEVTTYKQQVDLVVIPVFQRLDLLVDGIKCAVATSFYSNLSTY